MYRTIVPLLCVAFTSTAVAEFHLDFNTPGQYEDYFQSAQAGPITQTATGGLSNTGALDLSALGSGDNPQQIITFKHGFSSTLSSWTASIYYYGNAQSFWQFGVSTLSLPELDDFGYPASGDSTFSGIWLESGNMDGGSFAIAVFSPDDYDSVAQVIDGGLPTDDAWYRYTISGNYLGGNNYSIVGTLHQASSDGTLGTLLAQQTLNTSNSDFTGSEQLYFYINLGDGTALDNFYTDIEVIPEPSTFALLSGAAALGLLLARRRSREGGSLS